MIEAKRIRYSKDGQPTLTIEVTGIHDVYRVAHHLCHGQSDMAAVGFRLKRRLQRKVGKDRWAWLMRYMHGDGGFR